jgi:hypothetical protein
VEEKWVAFSMYELLNFVQTPIGQRATIVSDDRETVPKKEKHTLNAGSAVSQELIKIGQTVLVRSAAFRDRDLPERSSRSHKSSNPVASVRLTNAISPTSAWQKS